MLEAAAIETAIFETLAADSTLLTLLGGRKLYDSPRRDEAFPYLTLAIATSHDWSTGTEAGEEHVLQIHAWTGANQRPLNHAILNQVAQCLEQSPPTPIGCHLVNIQRQNLVMQADRQNRLFQGTLRYRLVTEPSA